MVKWRVHVLTPVDLTTRQAGNPGLDWGKGRKPKLHWHTGLAPRAGPTTHVQ